MSEKREKVIEQQKHDVMEDTFGVLSTQQENIDETALEYVFQKYNGQLQYLAVFSTENMEDFTRVQEEDVSYPIDTRFFSY